MDHSLFFIVNARIGKRKIATLLEAIGNTFATENIEICLTEYGGHAGVLAKEAIRRNFEIIVAVGGDGTVNEIMQHVVETKTVLAIVPMGSGNGLARHCSIPLQILEAVQLVKTGKPALIDVGKANDVFFISNAGVGFDAWVCNDIKQTKSRGLKMYVRKVIQNYFTYKSDVYTIVAEGKEFTEKAFFLNVANGKEFGYGFQIAPEATLQDGLLDMILVKKINMWNGFGFVLDGWRKKLIQNKNCIYIRAKKIEIRGKDLQYFQTDGDAQNCDKKCVIEVKENALRLLVPQFVENL